MRPRICGWPVTVDLRVPELNQLSWSPFVFPELGAEWYLRVRDFIYRSANE